MLIIWATMIAVTAAAPHRSGKKLITASGSHGKSSNSICETPVCVQEASMTLKKINPDVDPCDNFYQFACGRFLNETIIPNNTFTVNPFSSIQYKIKDQILISLSDEIKKNDLPVFQTMKSCYHMCMDTENIAKNAEKELKEVLTKLGGWPILHGSSWNGTNFDWQKFVVESGQMGYDTDFFMNVNVGYYLQVSLKSFIQIDYPAMGYTPKDQSSSDKNNPTMKAYVNYIRKVASILGANLEEAKEDLQNLNKFEQNLMNISHSVSGQYRTTVGVLEKKYPKIVWIEYIKGAIASNIHVDQNEVVLVQRPDFLEAFYALIAVTPNRVLANYAMWRIIRQSIPKMQGQLVDALTEFLRSKYGKWTEIPRRDECVSFIKKYFSTALGSLYVRLYFDKLAKTKVTSLVDDIRASLRNMIEQANWMDSITKGQALDKLDSMSQYIGYPDELINDEKLNGYYKNFKVYPESFFKTHMSLRNFTRKKDSLYSSRTGSESKFIGHSDAYATNAFYDRVENSLDIRAGILQEEFFNEARPNYMNYGAMGWIIGHEMTHGFDDLGRQFSKNGLLVDWWQPETKTKYSEKANCFIKQYNNYTIKQIGVTVDGQKTLDENVSDNGGLKAAYRAYNKWAQKNNREPQLPYLNYTPRQMFWISAASIWCNKIKKESLKSLVPDDVHSPSEFRVIGSMSNIPEFSNDFHCPPKSPMNPDGKCTIW